MSDSSGVPLTSGPQRQLGPFIGISAAADAVVGHLNRQVPGMDLWLVTCVVADRQCVIARAGRWADRAPVGAEFSWQASLCVRMVTGQGPTVAANFGTAPAYRHAAVGPLARVRSYLGVPVLFADGELFGTLCALGGRDQPDSLSEALPIATLLGQLLSSVLDGQRAAHARSADAANAYALAERDPQTGLRNRRGLEQAIATEQGRGLRFGTRSSVLLVALQDVDDLSSASAGDQLGRCAEVLTELCQPGDIPARIGGGEFGLLAVEADVIAVRALQARLRRSLRLAQLPAATGIATRRLGEDLTDTWQRARQALQAERRRPHSPLTSVRDE